MDSKSNSVFGGLTDNSAKDSFHSKEIQNLDDEEPYSFIGTSNALLSFFIAIGSIAIPIFAVLVEKPIPRKETAPISLEPYGSKHSRPISIARISQHSC